jgi:diaminopimelate epimerase
MIPVGRAFYKMSGSGNDFVMVDARSERPGVLASTAVIRRVCARGTGIGADGIVFLQASEHAAVRLTYLNADGSRADLCGNATLCTTRLAVELGIGKPAGFDIETDSGIVRARFKSGQPEIDLPPVSAVTEEASGIPLQHGEERIGFAVVGVPHLVIRCADVGTVDVIARGRLLRSHASLRDGANVNFVSPGAEGRWRMRTYERGVEGETLACGSGSVATAILLTQWGCANGTVELETSSGRVLTVTLRHDGQGWSTSLRGEGRIVYQAQLAEI